MRPSAIWIASAAAAAVLALAPAALAQPNRYRVAVVLAPGEITQIDGTSFRLGFEGVMGDSRCPADAFCIQGGDALVRINVYASRGPSTAYDLHTGNLRPIRHEELTVALKELQPYPFSSRTNAADEYRATLTVTR